MQQSIAVIIYSYSYSLVPGLGRYIHSFNLFYALANRKSVIYWKRINNNVSKKRFSSTIRSHLGQRPESTLFYNYIEVYD